MATTTANGGKCLTAEGASAAQTKTGRRGAALTALSLQLVGPRDTSLMPPSVRGGHRRRGGRGRGAGWSTRCRSPSPRRGDAGTARLEGVKAAVAAVLEENAALCDEAAADNVADLFALTFDTGDVREGAGERQLFVWLLLELLRVAPATTVATVPLIPTYASYRLLNLLYACTFDAALAKEAEADPSLSDGVSKLRAAVVEEYTAALRRDAAALASVAPVAGGATKPPPSAKAAAKGVKRREAGGGTRKPPVSLAAKWAPRSGCTDANKPLYKALKTALFPTAPSAVGGNATTGPKATDASKAWASASYRKLVAGLTRHLGVVEVAMAAGAWSTITPEHVPALALRRMRKAFLNVTAEGKPRSDLDDRKKCAEAFAAAAAATRANPTSKKRMKGAGNTPRDLVATCMSSSAEDAVVEAAWVDLTQSLRESGGALRSAVAVVDVSGSMTGLPMEAAVALGLLVAELAPQPFHDRLLTFSERPQWHVLAEEDTSLHSRVRSLCRAHWDMNTDFNAAMDEVLALCKKHRLPQSAAPEVMVVLTDMHFDDASHDHPYAAAAVKAKWEAAGYTPPHLLLWNLAMSGSPVFQAETSTPGVSFMSGFSQQALKDFCDTGVDALTDLTEVTPWDKLQHRLSRSRLHPVRAVLEAVGEGPLAGYKAPVVDDKPTDGAPGEGAPSAGAGAGAGAGGSGCDGDGDADPLAVPDVDKYGDVPCRPVSAAKRQRRRRCA